MKDRSAALLAVALLFVACSGDDGPTSHGSADLTPPSVVSITPLDMNHVDVTFSEAVSRASAENPAHFLLVATGISSMALGVPGDTMYVTPALGPDEKTVTITARPAMYQLTMSLSVFGVTDVHGNRIDTPIVQSFTSADHADETPPQLFYRSPAPGAVTVPIGTQIVMVFSEPLDELSFYSGVSWDSDAGPVEFRLDSHGTTYTLAPYELLPYHATQTISLSGIRDQFGNTMAAKSWSFTTTHIVDNTPPVVVATVPSDRAVNVDVNTELVITFSEPVNQFNFNVALHPDPPLGESIWSVDGKTFTYYPSGPFDDNQQYVMTVYPNGVTDLAGNTVTGFTTTVFTTGAELEAGSVSGVIAGHPGTAAADPTGAVVVAGSFEPEFYSLVATNDVYNLSFMEDGTYQIFAYKDTNHDGFVSGFGDALGAYGANIAERDFDLSYVTISNGAHRTNINFPIFDPSFMQGTVTYEGIYQDEYDLVMYVGLFVKAGFDPYNSFPIAVDDGNYWAFNNVDDELADGDYYVAAFLDVNGNGGPDFGLEPFGVHGGVNSPDVLHIARGSDVFDVEIPIFDPVSVSSAAAVSWPAPGKHDAFKRLCEKARDAELKVRRQLADRSPAHAATLGAR